MQLPVKALSEMIGRVEHPGLWFGQAACLELVIHFGLRLDRQPTVAKSKRPYVCSCGEGGCPVRADERKSIDPAQIPKRSVVHPALTVGSSIIDGQGVITREKLKRGTAVITWGGRVFTAAEVKGGAGRQHTLVGISENLLLGNPTDEPPSTDDYMNHSCSPNVGMSNEITIVTMRDIAAGDELVADYAVWLNNEEYVMKRKCNCRSPHCRGTIRGTDWRLPEVQRINAGFFSPFIARKIAVGRVK